MIVNIYRYHNECNSYIYNNYNINNSINANSYNSIAFAWHSIILDTGYHWYNMISYSWNYSDQDLAFNVNGCFITSKQWPEFPDLTINDGSVCLVTYRLSSASLKPWPLTKEARKLACVGSSGKEGFNIERFESWQHRDIMQKECMILLILFAELCYIHDWFLKNKCSRSPPKIEQTNQTIVMSNKNMKHYLNPRFAQPKQ